MQHFCHNFRSPVLALPRVITTVLVLGLGVGLPTAPVQAAPSSERVLQVGIVQRFGEKPNDTLTLNAIAGDQLTLRFKTNNQPQMLRVKSLKLITVPVPLVKPQVEERVVLSTNRSFETAEDSALYWQNQGIATEVAQPDRWQVWAKRDVYKAPLLRRLLLQSLQAKGIQSARIDTKTVTQVPRPVWVVNGYQYQRDELEITSKTQRIQVDRARDDEPLRMYAGSLRLQPNAYGNYTLVNSVPIETYLRGVVPHEIGAGAPAATIEAQAILARTYALRNLRRFAIDNYELCATTQCQVYWGVSGTARETDRAIVSTKGQVLTYQNELVDAVYSSTTGGVTAPFNDVWNGFERPYLRAVVDSVANIWDLSSKSLANEQNFRAFISRSKGFNEYGWEMFRWRIGSSLPEITQDLKTYLASVKNPAVNFKSVQRVQVTQRSAAGRVQKITVQTDRGAIEFSKDNILNAFSAPSSTLFYLEPIYGANKVLKGYTFVGGGFGHGVGLSQTGSYRLGELGWSSQRILGFYYPGTQLQLVNDSLTFWHNPAVSGSNQPSPGFN